jgi:hypothetical protein
MTKMSQPLERVLLLSNALTSRKGHVDQKPDIVALHKIFYGYKDEDTERQTA